MTDCTQNSTVFCRKRQTSVEDTFPLSPSLFGVFVSTASHRMSRCPRILRLISARATEKTKAFSSDRLAYMSTSFSCLSLSSSTFLSPTVLGRPRPLRMVSPGQLGRAFLLFSMSLGNDSMRSLRMRSVLRRLDSKLSASPGDECSFNRAVSSLRLMKTNPHGHDLQATGICWSHSGQDLVAILTFFVLLAVDISPMWNGLQDQIGPTSVNKKIQNGGVPGK